MAGRAITRMKTIDITKPRYKRRGKCNRCGACCLVEDPPCPYLKIKNGKATCLIFNSPDRPERCKWFPEMPPIPRQFKKCGYYFEDTWEDNKKVKHHLD
ncbi:hypothetical protein KKH13_04280 [Patescibacteria group bacterium]|nr:hypothetical protein [Patescibacteria group bacterium]